MVRCKQIDGAAMMSSVQSWVADTDEPSNQGHAFLAINVGAMMPLEEFHARITAMCKEIKSASAAEGGTIFLPGEMEWNKRERALTEGIFVPEDATILTHRFPRLFTFARSA